MQVTPHGGLANRCTRPLCDLSVATAAGILSWSLRRPAPERRPPRRSHDAQRRTPKAPDRPDRQRAGRPRCTWRSRSTSSARASTRWGKLFREQSIEEAQHAQKIIDFLVDNEVDFDLPALKATSTRFGSPAAAAKRALESERTVAGQFDRAAGVAVAAGDHRGFEFLQWFIAEQVEEETKLQHIVDLIESGINLFQAEGLLDSFE